MDKLTKALLMLMASIVSMLFKTWVIFYGYTNGLIPFGMPEIGYWQAFGLLMFVTLLTTDNANLRASDKDGSEGKLIDRMITSWVMYLIALLTFWIIF